MSSHNDTQPDVSVILPCTTDPVRIWSLVPQFVDTLEAAGDSYEILIVADVEIHGSFADLSAVHPHVAVVDRPQSSGATTNLIHDGLAAARGKYVAVFNNSMSCNPAGLTPLVEFCRNAWDLAVGVRHIGRDALRGNSGAVRSDRALRGLVNQAIDPAFDGNRAGMIVLTRETLEATLPYLRGDDSIFDIELIAIAKRVCYRRHAYHPVDFQGFAAATPDSTLARSMRSISTLAVRLHTTPEFRRNATGSDQRPRSARIAERRTHHLIGVALQLIALETPTEHAVQTLIEAAHGRLDLLEMAGASCGHDDRRTAGARWNVAEPLLRRAANHLRFDDLPSAAAHL